jgi:P27 family predicted phage terminase small subunit
MQQAKLDTGSPMPLLTKGAHGNAMASPYLRIIRNAAEQMLAAARELGFTPAARPRLATGQRQDGEDDASPWSRLRLIHGG